MALTKDDLYKILQLITEARSKAGKPVSFATIVHADDEIETIDFQNDDPTKIQ